MIVEEATEMKDVEGDVPELSRRDSDLIKKDITNRTEEEQIDTGKIKPAEAAII